MPLAVLFGLCLALMRMSRFKLLSWISATYIEVVRGTPLLVQMWLVYESLPQLGKAFHTKMLTWDSFYVGIICLAGNYAAYEADRTLVFARVCALFFYRDSEHRAFLVAFVAFRGFLKKATSSLGAVTV